MADKSRKTSGGTTEVPKAIKISGEATAHEDAFFEPKEKPAPFMALRGKPIASSTWANLVEALHQNRRRLLRLPGVTAVDIDRKSVV